MPLPRHFKAALVTLALSLFVTYGGLYDLLSDEISPPLLPQAWARLNLGPTSIPTEHIQIYGPDRGQTSTFRYCEDATNWGAPQSGLVIVSCDRWRRSWNTVLGPMNEWIGAQRSGSLWLVNATEARPVAKEFELVDWPKNFDFHPLGVEVAEDGERLVVVNHRVESSNIEIFKLSPFVEGETPKATYQYSLAHAAFNSPNSVAMSGSSGSLYVTHTNFFTRRFKGYRMGALRWIETLFGLPLTRVDVVHFSGPEEADGARLHVNIAARGIAFANGIVLTKDGKTLAVASTTSKKVYLYDRNPDTHELKYREAISVPMAVDNLSLAPKGFLDSDEEGIIAAGHPHRLSVLKVTGSRYPRSTDESWPGSWVVAITKRKEGESATAEDADDRLAPVPAPSRSRGTSKNWRVDTLYQSNGKPTNDPTLPPSFMTGTQGVVGTTEDGRNWLLQPGLYAEGVRLVRQVLLH